MERKFPLLSSPLTVGRLTLRNRIMSAPTTFPEPDAECHMTEDMARFYELRAKGGAAVVTVSEAMTHESGLSHGRHIMPLNPYSLGPLTQTARAIKRHGAVANIELSHGGRYAGRAIIDPSNAAPVHFGPVDELLSNGTQVRAMSQEMIREIVDSFGQAAAVIKQAGFEMVLIHAGHGWLIHQFLSPAVNRRQDEYGGSTEGRCRLLLEIIDSVRAAVGLGFPIEVRMSGDEYAPGGCDIEETIRIAEIIDEKIDLFHISTGNHETTLFRTHPSLYLPRGCNVQYAEAVKKHVKHPVVAIGAIDSPEMIEDILESGKADMVAMARGLLCDPEFPNKAIQGRDDEIVHCIRCFACLSERRMTQTRICSINPIYGMEKDYLSRQGIPAEAPKKVLVAGGGPAGMTAAITAARQGHQVILCEKTGHLGGALRYERNVPLKEDLYDFVRVKALAMEKAGVEVRLNTPVTPELAEAEGPDVLVVAVGAKPIVPPLPGVDGSNVDQACHVSEDDFTCGHRVVILGGGLVGCETAMHLTGLGHEVTIVEMRDQLAPDSYLYQGKSLREELERMKIRSCTGITGREITADGLKGADREGKECFFPADTVLLACGMRSETAQVEALRDGAPQVMIIGDCYQPGNMRQATFQGYYQALDI